MWQKNWSIFYFWERKKKRPFNSPFALIKFEIKWATHVGFSNKKRHKHNDESYLFLSGPPTLGFLIRTDTMLCTGPLKNKREKFRCQDLNLDSLTQRITIVLQRTLMSYLSYIIYLYSSFIMISSPNLRVVLQTSQTLKYEIELDWNNLILITSSSTNPQPSLKIQNI